MALSEEERKNLYIRTEHMLAVLHEALSLFNKTYYADEGRDKPVDGEAASYVWTLQAIQTLVYGLQDMIPLEV